MDRISASSDPLDDRQLEVLMDRVANYLEFRGNNGVEASLSKLDLIDAALVVTGQRERWESPGPRPVAITTKAHIVVVLPSADGETYDLNDLSVVVIDRARDVLNLG